MKCLTCGKSGHSRCKLTMKSDGRNEYDIDDLYVDFHGNKVTGLDTESNVSERMEELVKENIKSGKKVKNKQD